MTEMDEHAIELFELTTTGNATLDAFYDRWESFLIWLQPKPSFHQAIRTFPCAMWIVIQTRQQKQKSLPAIAAQHVIEAINEGQPIVETLAAFFRTTRAVIRNSRRWPLETIQGISNWRTACRFIHCRGVIGPMPAALDGSWEHLRTVLPIIDMIARRFQLTRRELLNSLEATRPFNLTPQTMPAQPWHALRHLLKTLDALVKHSASETSQPMHGYIRDTFTRDPYASPPRLSLPSGWSATALRNWQDIADETCHMRHCIADFGEEAINGSVQLFSLRSGNNSDRATVMLDPPATTTHRDIRIHIAGPDNDPVSLPALRALVELLQHLGPDDVRFFFS